jgi:hypothetical protein
MLWKKLHFGLFLGPYVPWEISEIPVYGVVFVDSGQLGAYLTLGSLALALSKWEDEASSIASMPPRFLLVAWQFKYDF